MIIVELIIICNMNRWKEVNKKKRNKKYGEIVRGNALNITCKRSCFN